MIAEIICAIAGTIAFAVIFNAPKSEYSFCALTGVVGWIAYLTAKGVGADTVVASLFATVVLTLLSRILSIIRKCPTTVFLVTGIFTLVPGAGIYYTSYYLIMNDFSNFSVTGAETFKIAAAIVIGIILGFLPPQNWFRIVHKISK